MIQIKAHENSVHRIDSLDYLRGLAALGIMFYHMHLFTYGEVDSSSVLAKVKIYDVAIFYVLSGLTLCVVHLNNFQFKWPGIREFYLKRFFRIVPLLWLATILTYLFDFSPELLSVKKIIANVLIIPGALKPETFIPNGAWSIGDELFFYIVFPFMMFLGKFSKKLFWLLVAITFAFLAWFAFKKLNPAITLGHQWAVFVNPVGQVFFFVAGMGLGFIEKSMQKFGVWSVMAIAIILVAILNYPAAGEPVQLVTGLTRIALSLLTIALCFLVYKTNFDFLSKGFKKVFTMLGEVSYSLYLIHPIVYHLLKWLIGRFTTPPPLVLIILTIMLTICLSYLSYHYFETYFINIGRRINNRLKLKPA